MPQKVPDLTRIICSAIISYGGKYSAKWISWSMAYCLVSYGLQTYIAILVCHVRFQALIDSQSVYDEFIFSIHVLAYLIIHFHVPFTYWLQASRMAHYCTLWAQFQDDWETTMGRPLKMTHRKTVIIFILILLPTITLLLVFEQYSTLHDPLLYFLPYLFTLSATGFILCIWFITCLEIRRLFQELTTALIEKVNSHPTPWFLQRWRVLWLSLKKLAECLGRDICAVLFSIMVTYGSTFLMGLYNAFTHIISYGITAKAGGYVSAALLSLSFIYVICDGGHRATSGVVSKAIGCILMGKQAVFNQEIRYELSLVLETIKSSAPEMTLGGFATINRHQIVSLISTILTYVIVLLQFKVSEDNGLEIPPEQ